MNSGELRFLTSHEVATLIQVSPSAVLRWIDQGRLRAFRTPGGHRRVASAELVDFLRTHQMPVPRQLAPLRLLVIDDEARYLKALKVLLEPSFIEVELRDNPVDGLLAVGLRRPDVILLDVYMPGMDGAEVCRRLKASSETKDITVIAMSGSAAEDVVEELRAAGAAAFLPKPLTAQAVLAELAQLGLTRSP